MSKKMWGYLMHLSDNMWGDPGSRLLEPCYHPVLTTDQDVWDNTINFLPSQGINFVLIDVGDAMQYERHPEISVEGAWSKDKLKAELDRMRSMGLTPYPKLNFSAGHDAWLGVYSRMLSTPTYYQVCKDCIEEVAEVFGTPEFFHLGLEEEDSTNQGALSMIIVRQMELLWHDIFKLFEFVEGAGCTPWIWSGLAWNEKDLPIFLERMPRDVLQSNYWYNRLKKLPNGKYQHHAINVYGILDEAGFKQIPTVSFFEGYSLNAEQTLTMGKNDLTDSLLLGYMTAPWRNPRPNNRYSLLDDAYRFGLAKKKIYPEECE